MSNLRIWDLPTRLFHWLLVICLVGLMITGNVGGNAMVWHFRLGLSVLTLLLFRLIWGFVGGHWSRWAQLTLSPRQVLAYLRGESAQQWAGHNPMGSWSVLLMLLWLLIQVSTGLVSDDEISNAGPFAAMVSGATVTAATAWHKGLGKWVLIFLVLTHVSAIVWYGLCKKQPLLPAMLKGDKVLPDTVPSSRDSLAHRMGAVAVLLVCVALIFWLLSLAGT